MTNAPLVVYSGYGLIWIAIIALLLSSRARDVAIFVSSLVLMPMLITALTVDQTRVWVGVTALASLITIRALAAKLRGINSSLIVGSAIIIGVFLPSLEVTYLGELRGPFAYMYFMIVQGGLVSYF